MDLLPNYTFYKDNIPHRVIAHRRCDKFNNVQFMKNWEKYAVSFDAGLYPWLDWLQITVVYCINHSNESN